MPDRPPSAESPPSPRQAWVDAALCAFAALPVLAVLIDSGDLFLWSVIGLPVAIVALGSVDPIDPVKLQRVDDPQARRRR